MGAAGRTSRALLRGCLRWARRVERLGAPLEGTLVEGRGAVGAAEAALALPGLAEAGAPLRRLLRAELHRAAWHPTGSVRERPGRLSDARGVRKFIVEAWRASAGVDSAEADELLDSAVQVLAGLGVHTADLEGQLEQREANADRGGLAFKVGDVVRHKRYVYRGAVFGWDRECRKSEQWAKQMGVKWDQPFYSVLPDEGDSYKLFGAFRHDKYVAESNLELVGRKGRRVVHRELPRFFVGFCDTSGTYVPRRFLRYLYPSDVPVGPTLGSVGDLGSDTSILRAGEEEEEED